MGLLMADFGDLIVQEARAEGGRQWWLQGGRHHQSMPLTGQLLGPNADRIVTLSRYNSIYPADCLLRGG